jgi:inosose dehydratase
MGDEMVTEPPSGLPGVTHVGQSGAVAPLLARVAAAPISWGISEVPGWGYQLDADRVLTEMRSLGLTSTEFGPDGFLRTDPGARAEQLRVHGMSAIGGFLPVLLHDATYDPLPSVDRFIDVCVGTGADVVVLAAYAGAQGYDTRPPLDEAGWTTLLTNLDRIDERAEARGMTATLHPHVGTMVERPEEVDRILDGSHVGLCIDTGHLQVGGGDAVALTVANASRVNHVHLKDVDMTLAARVLAGGLAFGDAVRQGMFRPLGRGDIDIAALVGVLEGAGYSGWYVLEQDVMLDGEPDGEGPLGNVRESLQFLVGAVR